MSLRYYLRLPLVCLILSVVECFPELSVGDIMENAPKIKKLALENFRSVNPAIQTPIRRTLQRNPEQFNNRYRLLTINSSARSQINYVNAINPTEAEGSANVRYYSSIPKMISSNVNSANNHVELSRYKEGIDAKRNYAFQTVQQEQNPLYFTWNQKRFSDIKLSPWLKKKGLTNGVPASFGYQHLSKPKSEMYFDSSRPLGLNEPYLRGHISAQPIIRPTQAERIPANYMTGSSTMTYDMRHKSDGDVLFPQNNGQNKKRLRKVVPISASLSIVRANRQASKSLPREFSAPAEVPSYENVRDAALSKMFKPPAVQTPITPVFKKSNSNGGQSILPSRKAQLFSSQHVQVKQSNSERFASSKVNLQRSFVHGNAKSPMSSYTFKDIQLTSTQNGGQGPNSMPNQMFQSKNKYYNLGMGLSVIRPSETSGTRSYKGFFSNENGGIRRSALSNQSKQDTSLTQQMQFAKNTLFSGHDSRFKLPDTTTNSLTKSTRNNTHKKTDLNSSSQSAVQSLFIKSYPVPGNTMKNDHSISPSVSSTQSTSKNAGMSSRQNRPYYLTSKKPFAFRSFTFLPTLQKSLQKPEMHSGQKPFIKSSSNTQYAPAHPPKALRALSQKPLMPNSYEKTSFQVKDIETSQEKQPDQERKTVSSTEAASNTKSVAPQQLVPSKTSQRWISSRFTPAKTESNHGEIPIAGSSITRFVEPNTFSTSIKSSNVHDNHASELVLPIYRPSMKNKVTGYSQTDNAVIQPLHRYNLKEHEDLVNPKKEIKKDRNSFGATQSNNSENDSATRLRPSSSFVIGRRVSVTQEGKGSGENLNKSIHALPSPHSVIYRAADVNRHKTNSSSAVYRSANKPNLPSAWMNKMIQDSEMDIDLSAVGVSQGSRPTSSFVVGRYANAFNKVSSKSNLNVSSTKTGLNYKPVQVLDVVGSASFIKPHSAESKTREEVDLGSVQNHSDSIPLMEEHFKELLFDTTIGSSSLTSALQKETDEGRMDSSGPELMTTAAIDLTTESQLSFTEERTRPQPTVYFSEPLLAHTTPTVEGTDPFYEGALTPNATVLVTLSSE